MRRGLRRCYVALGAVVVLGVCRSLATEALAQWAPAASDAENPAIAYSATEPADAVARLQRAIDSGKTLPFDRRHGYLPAVLRELNVPVSSQGLVFSRTSFQRDLISPARPRALYFNRDLYVGWVPGSATIEIAAVDPTLGAVFYTLAQNAAAPPRFERQTRACLRCHDSASATAGVPGLIMKSVSTDGEGEPIASAGADVMSDRTPMHKRWGGWYVTGTHGAQPHMGNAIGVRPPGGTPFDAGPYLSSHSDLVALTVLAHQSHVQNLLTRVGYRTRMALYFDRQRNAELGRSRDDVPEPTRRLIERVAEPLVRALVFVDEAPLVEPVAGTSGFSDAFAQQGPRDHRGRSLFELDLTRRLLRYPCSYLIYSAAFDALPAPAREYVYGRLWEVLSGKDASQTFAHLSHADRADILEILLDTKPEFAAYAP